MIWFIIAISIAVVGGILIAIEDDGFEGFLAFLWAGVCLSAVAVVVNLITPVWVDDKTVDTKPQSINGPVFITLEPDSGLLVLNLDSEDRSRYTDYGVQAEFHDSPDRTFSIRDYRPGNKWLSVFNYEGDHLIINIPASEQVELTRK